MRQEAPAKKLLGKRKAVCDKGVSLSATKVTKIFAKKKNGPEGGGGRPATATQGGGGKTADC